MNGFLGPAPGSTTPGHHLTCHGRHRLVLTLWHIIFLGTKPKSGTICRTIKQIGCCEQAQTILLLGQIGEDEYFDIKCIPILPSPHKE